MTVAFAACAALVMLAGCGSGAGGSSSAALGGAPATPTPVPIHFTATVIPGNNVTGYEINNAGRIAGSIGQAACNSLLPTLFQFQNGSAQTLSGYTFGFFHGLNEAGQAVGTAGGAVNLPREAFVYANNAVQPLPAVFGPNAHETAVANDINAKGQVVGSSIDRTNELNQLKHAVLWENGQGRDLGIPEGFPNALLLDATAINDNGQIIGGYSNTIAEQRAFVWENGRMRDLGTLVPGSQSTVASAINNAGQIVGWSSGDFINDRAYYQAVLWENGVLHELGVLAIGSPDDDYSRALDINNQGQIVGVSSDHAVLWQNGTITDLHHYATDAFPTAIRSEAVSVNDNGQIVIAVQEPGNNTPNRLVVLTPNTGR